MLHKQAPTATQVTQWHSYFAANPHKYLRKLLLHHMVDVLDFTALQQRGGGRERHRKRKRERANFIV